MSLAMGDAEPSPFARDVEAVLERVRRRTVQPSIAAMELVAVCRGVAAAAHGVRTAAQRGSWPRWVVAGLLDLLERGDEGCARVSEEARSAAQATFGSSEEALEAQRRFFDTCVGLSEEASVALYSLGSPELLRRSTDEIVRLFAELGLLGPSRTVLHIGCGIGRVEEALSPHVAEAHGVDLSPKMIEAARRRCRHLPNVFFTVTSGRDLGGYASESFSLVYAIDVFPYVVSAGPDVLRAVFDEATRVLAPGGALSIVNFSYRGDLEVDRRDATRLAEARGLDLVLSGARPFRTWDGAVFHMKKRTP